MGNTKFRLLIVDDNPGNRLVLKYNLGGHFDIEFANSGLSAIDKFKNNTFDLILMDIHMPEMDGLETTAEVRKMENGKKTPIFAITSNVFVELKEQCLKSGMNDLITKPIHAKALIDRINNYLNNQAYK